MARLNVSTPWEIRIAWVTLPSPTGSRRRIRVYQQGCFRLRVSVRFARGPTSLNTTRLEDGGVAENEAKFW
jgi:hypothetical protein